MRIERKLVAGLDMYEITLNGSTHFVGVETAHALVRLGMGAQRQRSAEHVAVRLASEQNKHQSTQYIRAQTITDQDITAALEKANG